MAVAQSSLVRYLLPVALAVVASQSAAAQEAGVPTPDEPWAKICNTDPNNSKELCLVLQEVRADTGQFIASATVRQITGEPKISFIVAVPPGMMIQPGIRAQVDGGTQHEIPYGICFQNACYGELEVNQDFIQSLKNGSQLVITAVNQGGQPASIPLSLKGFTKTFDGPGLDAAAAEQRQEDLNKALQARAEEARKRLIEQQQKEAQTN